MSRHHAYSSPDLLPSSIPESRNDLILEGVAVNVKLLLKLIQDHKEASKDGEDGREPQRVAHMLRILEDVKSRVEKSQLSIKKPAELRRCNTDLKRTPVPRDKKPQEPIADENQQLRKQLSASLAARKSLERMFSGLGKEKEIMASELTKKVQELNGLEEHLNDLKAQNEILVEKLKSATAELKVKKNGVGDTQGNLALQERNKALSEQLSKALDAYRASKRKLKDAQEVNAGMQANMAEITEEVSVGLNRIQDLRHQIIGGNHITKDIEKEISSMEEVFRCFQAKVSKAKTERTECAKLAANLPVEMPPVLV